MELFKLESLFPEEFAKLSKLNLLPAGSKDWGAVRLNSVPKPAMYASRRFCTTSYQKKDFYKLISRMI